ncbi:hypothetical protein Glove_209g176 [Diversispora epigaea]|uniref:Uncharacterized protein n=1 Tax=Diversispora epigaea TaxID=1348612 RepID=A0A397INQ3_9GLOM|nr:hypothetical protein Glove_209g176 [Diversispora epigaea]
MSHIRMFKNPVLIKVKSEKAIDDKEAVQSIRTYLKSGATEALPQKKLDNLKKLQRFLSRSNKFNPDSVNNKRKCDELDEKEINQVKKRKINKNDTESKRSKKRRKS